MLGSNPSAYSGAENGCGASLQTPRFFPTIRLGTNALNPQANKSPFLIATPQSPRHLPASQTALFTHKFC